MISLLELARPLADLVAPRVCAGCGASLGARRRRASLPTPGSDRVRAALRDVLCPACRAHVRAIGPGACRACGRARPPFAPDPGPRCGRCWFEARGGIRRTVAAYRYTSVGRDLLRDLKFFGRRGLAAPLGRALASRVETELPALVGACGVALVTAVPIHWTRRLVRGFNQAALLGQSCARELGLPFQPQALARRRRTRALFAVGRGDRSEELAGAIVARPELVRDRWVLVVDDIRTSGSTLAACGRALLAAGAVRVDAAVIGR